VNKLLFTLPLILLLIPLANAEKITVDVPFESHGYSCTLIDTVNELAYTCTFEGTIRIMTEEDLMKFESVLTEEELEQALEEIKEAALQQIIIEKENKKTFTEMEIERLQEKYDRGVLKTNQIEYLKLLKALDQCEQGIGKARQIQDYRSFDISTKETSNLTGHDFTGNFGKLAKAIEECKGQYQLENYILGGNYDNIIGGEIKQRYHADGLEGIQSIPFDKFRETSNKYDLNSICNLIDITESHKKGLGCIIQYDGQSNREIQLQNEKRFGTDGVIKYESDVLKKYHKFLNSNK
jgi:hypothetical protein